MSDQPTLFPASDAVGGTLRDWPIEMPEQSPVAEKPTPAPADQPSLFDTGDAA
jgi:hypothetical protein